MTSYSQKLRSGDLQLAKMQTKLELLTQDSGADKLMAMTPDKVDMRTDFARQLNSSLLDLEGVQPEKVVHTKK